ncbi:unnamed protein product [Arabis nemorensis]|uniref:J domain-containing protein n=1 Tax=Arabis nemorensis TaxID=586526 RepID=A0A565CFI6_9BRAS|nr:unnamed protein product [Arabis nemorensis]
MYPELENLEQVLMKAKGEADLYEILGVDPLANDKTVKKQYLKLALLLHPDKNKFHGAEEAFKLVLEAWSLLSDKDMREAYDRKRKSKQVKQRSKTCKKQKPTPHEEPYFYTNWDRNAKEDDDPRSYDRKEEEEEDQRCYDPESEYTFWTVCNRCTTYCQFGKANYLNKTLSCPNCSQDFVATEIIPEMVDGCRVYRFSTPYGQEQESTRKNTSDTRSLSTSTSDSANANQAGGK